MNDSIKSYRDLEVWRKAMAFTKSVYVVTGNFPSDEKFGLINQMRRAAVSIPSNIAEGHARIGAAEFKHFISIALGSAAELETQIILSADLGYLKDDLRSELLGHLGIIGKMLRGLYKSLANRR